MKVRAVIAVQRTRLSRDWGRFHTTSWIERSTSANKLMTIASRPLLKRAVCSRHDLVRRISQYSNYALRRRAGVELCGVSAVQFLCLAVSHSACG